MDTDSCRYDKRKKSSTITDGGDVLPSAGLRCPNENDPGYYGFVLDYHRNFLLPISFFLWVTFLLFQF